MEHANSPLARDLILDELFDLTLYRELHKSTQGDLQRILGDLIPVEERHFGFWRDFFKIDIDRLDWMRRVKLRVLVSACRLFGSNAVHLVLEAIEIYGVRKYLAVWEQFKDQPLGAAVRQILEDEFQHEDTIVSQMSERKIDPERVRNIFLGLNDGLVEILGAVSGFFASFNSPAPVLMASLSVAVAGTLSMAAGAYVASDSEDEVERIDRGKAAFLGTADKPDSRNGRPFRAALVVGISYFFGALVPVLPVVFGAKSVLVSILTASGMIILVSLVLAFLSGMRIRKRIFTNLVIIAAAVGVSYLIGSLAKNLWGLDL